MEWKGKKNCRERERLCKTKKMDERTIKRIKRNKENNKELKKGKKKRSTPY